MKAITCSQCGAMIKGVSMKKEIVVCDYCGSEMFLKKFREKVIEVPSKDAEKIKTKSDWEIYLENRKKIREKFGDPTFHPDHVYNNSDNLGPWIVGIIAILIFIGVPLLLMLEFSEATQKAKTDDSKKSAQGTAEKVKELYKTETPTPTASPTPLPEINYRSYVKYNTNIGAEYLPLPTITAEQLPTFKKDELRKTVFKQKRIRVKVTINKDGEVTDAKALNGHEVLKESSVEAAKKALFKTRRRTAKTTLTYIYVLEK